MGRGALRVRVTKDNLTVDLITAHLKSKLLTFPGGRFTPRNEEERPGCRDRPDEANGRGGYPPNLG
jgi:hypothetical protein